MRGAAFFGINLAVRARLCPLVRGVSARRLWVVSESAIGSVLSFQLDDETGSLIKKGRLGIR